jgi:hypothetical protein
MPDCLRVFDVNASLDRLRAGKFDIDLDVAPRWSAIDLDHASIYIIG